jgi:hypothetical protein
MISAISLTNAANEQSPQGGALLVQRAREFVERVVRNGPTNESLPTVATSKGRFAPVLLDAFLRTYPESYQAVLQMEPQLQKTASIAAVLDGFRVGDIPHPVALRATLKQKMMRPYKLCAADAFFDFLIWSAPADGTASRKRNGAAIRRTVSTRSEPGIFAGLSWNVRLDLSCWALLGSRCNLPFHGKLF